MDEDDLAPTLTAVVDRAVASGAEVGVQVSVVRGGRTIVELARGVADPDTGAPVGPDTLFWAGSVGKGIASTVVHVAIEKGLLRDDQPVAEVWPEFAAHGKERITVRHVLDHTAGVPFLPSDTTAADLCDWDHMCSAIAGAVPAWEAGTRCGYHATTFGFLAGEILRRATGLTISALLREWVTGPLGVADEVHFGVPERLLPRVACQVAAAEPPPPEAEPGSPMARAMPAGVVPDASRANRPERLTCDIPSEATMSARGAARVHSALLGQGGGVALVAPERLATMAAITSTGRDEVMGVEAEWAYGFSPFRPDGHGRPGSTFGMVGMGGSVVYADIDTGVAVAVLHNRFATGDLTLATSVDRLVHAAFATRGDEHP